MVKFKLGNLESWKKKKKKRKAILLLAYITDVSQLLDQSPLLYANIVFNIHKNLAFL